MKEVDEEIIKKMQQETYDAMKAIHQKYAKQLGMSVEELNRQIFIYHYKCGRFKNINSPVMN